MAERLTTILARDQQTVFRMSGLVNFQISLLCESQSTRLTLVRLITTMHFHMAFQVISGAVAILAPANSAPEGLAPIAVDPLLVCIHLK